MTENPDLPTAPEALLAHLEALGIAYELYHHEAVFTAAEAAHLKDEIPGIHCKNLFVKDKKDKMALIVVPDEVALDLKALAPAIGMQRLSFGSPERLWTYLGVTPGSVCPYAAINDTANAVRVIVDAAIMRAGLLSAHPMLNTMSITISPAGLLRFLENAGHAPEIIELSAYSRQAAA